MGRLDHLSQEQIHALLTVPQDISQTFLGYDRKLALQIMLYRGWVVLPERPMHPNAKMSGGDLPVGDISHFLSTISIELEKIDTYKSSDKYTQVSGMVSDNERT